ncbi:chromosomal replication initiator protein DnaA [Flaviflagellibacter deserti]|uniref:Chromosomal replication initiator protein DnaA n=1 Tax=Flaviflagellibacter deserti TaxID=2267266 RepID=A0ABV9Z7J1_9HYPH
MSAPAHLPAGGDFESAWQRTQKRLRAELGEDIYLSWFARIELERVSDSGMAHLSVPTRFLKSWIQSHYAERIVRAFSAEHGDIRQIELELRTVGVRPQPARGAAAQPAAAKPEHIDVQRPTADPTTAALVGSPIDHRLAFDSFLVGRSNALAHAAAREVASARPSEAIRYNPLYIHSAVGLGKTHLLHAIAGAAEAGGRRVVYLTAERFMFGFVSALRAQTSLAFKETLRGIDMLVIDDVQFLQGKTVQAEFGHTLNALIDAGRQVVVAADRPPAELESLDERLRSRLAGGLAVEMGSLDEELRLQILKNRLAAAQEAHPNFDVPPSVLSYVARTVTANGRDLEGAITRLMAHNTLTGTQITLEMAEEALRDLVRNREPKRVKIEDIQRIVARHYNVSRADILSARRTATVVRPRQIAMYLAKVLTLRSLPEIGRRFGGRDHTTVLHAVRKIDGLLKSDNSLAEDVDLLKRMLSE